MKAVKISFVLLFVSVVMAISTTLWKKECNREKLKLSTGKVKEEISVEQELLTESVEKEVEREENNEDENSEVNVPSPEMNELNEDTEKQNHNVQQEDKKSQVIENNITQSINNNSINSQTPEKIQEAKTEENKDGSSISNESQTPVYTKENDVVADPRLIKDKSTYQECVEYGQKIIEVKPECQSGCAISCRKVMGKYTGETIGYMLTIRLMDGYGTIVPFRRD